MQADQLFIFGFGFTSQAVADACRSRFSIISGTTRSVEKASYVNQQNTNPIVFDGVNPTIALEEQLSSATHLLISIAPDEGGDPVLNACRDLIKFSVNLKGIIYLSTVGVYGNHDGGWVDEMSECRPVSKRSKQRVVAENQWLDFASEMHLPLAIFRLSGIYGPGRNPFMNIEKGVSRRLVKSGQVFNRIHREDIGEAARLAFEKSADGIFNITDDEPAPPQDVVTLAHELMGILPPQEIDFATAELSPMARSFYGENKRVSNAKSKAELGLVYQYPNYHDALKRMWQEGSWR